MFRYLFSLFIIMTACISSIPAQDDRRINVETTHLNENVYMLSTRAGGNLGVCVSEEGAVLVDAEYAALHDQVMEAIEKISDQPLRFVINTHWHFDHTQGNAGFAKKGSLIIAHINVRKRLAVDQHIGILDYDVPASPVEALPSLEFESSFTLYHGDEKIRVVHAPEAHTDGDGIVYFQKANVVHTGDLFFNCGYPFIDVTNGGNIDGVISAVEKILSCCDEKTKIIPGHGPLATKTDLANYLTLLRDFRAIIAAEMAAGKDLETIVSEKPTAELDAKWGALFFPPELFIEMVFLSLTKK